MTSYGLYYSQEILDMVLVLNLDTGESIPLSQAEEKLPQWPCFGPRLQTLKDTCTRFMIDEMYYLANNESIIAGDS